MRDSLLVAFAIALLVPSVGVAQESVYVHVATNYPEAVLYADSVLVGTVADRPVAVPAHSRTLRLVPPDMDAWSISPVSAALDAEAGDTVAVRLDFPYHYRLESIPFGADVLIESDQRRDPIGVTPLLFRSKAPLQGRIVVSKAGYAIERLHPEDDVWNRYVVTLEPSDELDPTAAQVNWRPPRRHRAWIDYAALGATLAAGALAVHYKFRADDLYAEYEETEDLSLKPIIHRYDTRAGIAFGAMQLGIGVFAVRLALR